MALIYYLNLFKIVIVKCFYVKLKGKTDKIIIGTNFRIFINYFKTRKI
jgi:hypothetical protein